MLSKCATARDLSHWKSQAASKKRCDPETGPRIVLAAQDLAVRAADKVRSIPAGQSGIPGPGIVDRFGAVGAPLERLSRIDLVVVLIVGIDPICVSHGGEQPSPPGRESPSTFQPPDKSGRIVVVTSGAHAGAPAPLSPSSS